jgi:predicted SAM-dependent methyltransferase
MRSQKLKDLYFTLVRPITKVNHYRHRVFCPISSGPSSNGPIWLNIGSGEKYLKGFINIEGNLFRRKDLWLDIRNGFPFPPNSVDGLYACHIFEHLYLSDLKKVLIESHRILKPGSGMRVLVPSLEEAIHAYVGKNSDWFTGFPTSFKSLGGKFFNLILCDSQHKLVFDFSFMNEVLEEAGFSQITKGSLGQSYVFPADMVQKMEDKASEYILTSLIVEAIK